MNGQSPPLLPRALLVKQRFPRPKVADPGEAARAAIRGLGLGAEIRPGSSVAVTAGSRGIHNLTSILRATVDELRAQGALPFLVPAMGGHGGGTADGQRAVLHRIGVTEEALGCEIRASMEVEEIGRTRFGTPILMDRQAFSADAVAVVNRVKPHTKFSGEIESGLLKMCLIGLGKQRGARVLHRAIDRDGWMQVLETAWEVILKRAPLLLGLAVLENAHGETAEVAALRPADFRSEEPRLLARARGLMGRLPFNEADLLIVDRMGKELSGTGMDTNVTGRKPGCSVRVAHLFVRDLTEKTQGNAQGIGLADFTTRRLIERIDRQATYLNSQTAFRTDSCKLPMYLDTDREVLNVATAMAGLEIPGNYRLQWIQDTLRLDRVVVSEAYAKELEEREDLEVQGGPFPIEFDPDGNLITPFEDQGFPTASENRRAAR